MCYYNVIILLSQLLQVFLNQLKMVHLVRFCIAAQFNPQWALGSNNDVMRREPHLGARGCAAVSIL